MKRIVIAGGIVGLVSVEVLLASCTAAPPPLITSGGQPAMGFTDDGSWDHRPQGTHLRGSKLDNYLYFFGTVDKGKIQPTDEKGTALAAGKLTEGLEDGSVASVSNVKYNTTTIEDPCIYDSADVKIAAVPTYQVDDALGNLCGAPQSVGGDRDDQYYATPDDRVKCHDPKTGAALHHESMTYRAIAVAGYWDANGIHHAKNRLGKDVFTLGCINAVVAKCVHWGYVPWVVNRVPPGAGSAVPLGPYHEACVYAARADYKGVGKARTCGTTDIDIFDNIGIQIVSGSAPADFEAGWRAPDPSKPDAGPVACVKRTRYRGCEQKDSISIDAGCAYYYDPAHLGSNGIILGNYSVQDQNLIDGGAGACPGTAGNEERTVCQ